MLALVRKIIKFKPYSQVVLISILVISGWGSWTSWSSCSATCGGGQRTRQRVCMTSGGGADCHGTIEHKVICNKISCPGELDI